MQHSCKVKNLLSIKTSWGSESNKELTYDASSVQLVSNSCFFIRRICEYIMAFLLFGPPGLFASSVDDTSSPCSPGIATVKAEMSGIDLDTLFWLERTLCLLSSLSCTVGGSTADTERGGVSKVMAVSPLPLSESPTCESLCECRIRIWSSSSSISSHMSPSGLQCSDPVELTPLELGMLRRESELNAFCFRRFRSPMFISTMPKFHERRFWIEDSLSVFMSWIASAVW